MAHQMTTPSQRQTPQYPQQQLQNSTAPLKPQFSPQQQQQQTSLTPAMPQFPPQQQQNSHQPQPQTQQQPQSAPQPQAQQQIQSAPLSQPQPTQPIRPFSPYQNSPASLPPPGMALPPNKRQRLSPNPSPSSPNTHPYGTPNGQQNAASYSNTTYQQQHATYNPYSPVAAASPPSFNAPQPIAANSPAFNTPQPIAANSPAFNTPQPLAASPAPVAAGVMGPPPRPNPEKPEKEDKEKIHDISDVTDVFHGSGIDIREEENYMANSFRNTHASTSFNASAPSSNNTLGSLGNLNGQASFAGHGPISQAPATEQDLNRDIERKHFIAARQLAESRQQHLRDSFLNSNRVRHRMHQIAYEQGVALDVTGLFDKIEPAVQATTMNGQAIVATQVDKRTLADKPKDGLLTETAPLADLLSLVSIAANERARSMLDDAYRLARGRRYGSHGLVPPEFADVATGDDPKPTTADPNLTHDSKWETRKRGFDGEIKPKDSASPVPTITFSDTLSKHLLGLAVQDRDAEKERIKRRQERAKRAKQAENGTVDVPMDGPVPSTTGTPSGAATPGPDVLSQIAPEKPMTKKEKDRLAKMGQTEEAMHNNANQTAAMALAIGGKKKKRYSWMDSSGGAAIPSNPYKPATKAASPAANGAVGGKSPAGSAGSGVDKALQVRERKWGDWREDGIEGRGIQIRDWIQVLERDGREKKALEKAFLRLDSPAPAPGPAPPRAASTPGGQ